MGSYDITPAAATQGAKYGNYNITFVKGTLTINKAALTVTANDQTKEYDGQVFSGNYTFSIDGLASGDDFSDVIGGLSYGEAETATEVGEYDITLTATSYGSKYGNYTVSLNAGTLTITEASSDNE